MLIKHSKGDLKLFLLSSLYSTLVSKYALLRFIKLLYLALPSEFKIILEIGIVSSSFIGNLFLLLRSTYNLTQVDFICTDANINAAL